MARRPPHPDAPDAVPEDPPVPELLAYLGLRDPMDRAEDPGHARRRDGGRAVDAAKRAAHGE